MRWSITELSQELKLDPKRRVLFVEGNRDVAFWRELIPSQDRGDTVIYPISVVECPKSTGGERGRLVWCAGQFLNGEYKERILFFADADADPLLGRMLPLNVITTDYRDLEGYAFNENCIGRIVRTGLAKENIDPKALMNCLIGLTKPIGLLRIVAERRAKPLPFTRTLENRFLRYVDGNGIALALLTENLLTALLQNAQLSLSELSDWKAALSEEAATLKSISVQKIVHGKDFIRALAAALAIDEGAATGMAFLSLDFQFLAMMPNVAKVKAWVVNRCVKSDEPPARSRPPVGRGNRTSLDVWNKVKLVARYVRVKYFVREPSGARRICLAYAAQN